MIIRSLTLNDFRSYAETRIEFDPRLNIISGINGSGKSSLIDGICLLLCERTPSVGYRKDSFTELIRKDSTNEQFVVTAEIEESGTIEKIRGIFSPDTGFKVDGGSRSENRTAVLWALAPAMFFDSDDAGRQNMIAEILEISIGRAAGKWSEWVNENGPDDYKPVQIASVRDVFALQKRLDGDRKVAAKQQKELEKFAAIPDVVADIETSRLRELEKSINRWDLEIGRVDSILKNYADVDAALDHLSELESELPQVVAAGEAARENITTLEQHAFFSKSRACPLGMACPHGPADFEACAERAIQELPQAENDRRALQERYKSIHAEIAKLGQVAAAWKRRNELLAQKSKYDMETQERDRLLAQLDFAGKKADLIEKKVLYKRVSAELESIKRALEFVEKHLLALYTDLDGRFNTVLERSGFPLSWKKGQLYYEGRRYQFLSPSQKYRCQLTLAVVIGAGVSGFVVCDNMEILDEDGRKRTLGLIREVVARGIQAFIVGSYTRELDPAQPIPIKRTSAGKSFWLSRAEGITRVAEV